MKNKWLLLSLCAGYSFALCAQNPENDPVLMKVNGKSIKKSEFEYIYKKNKIKIVLLYVVIKYIGYYCLA